VRTKTLAVGPPGWASSGPRLAQPGGPTARVSVLPFLPEDGRRSSFRNVILLKYRRWTVSKKTPLQTSILIHSCGHSHVFFTDVNINCLGLNWRLNVYFLHFGIRTFHLGLWDVLVPLWHAVSLDVIGCSGGGLLWSSVVAATATAAAGTTALLQSAALARLSREKWRHWFSVSLEFPIA
jgi:hypothetical protein